MNFSLRLPNACMRFKASLADTFTRRRRFLLNALLSSGFSAISPLRNSAKVTLRGK